MNNLDKGTTGRKHARFHSPLIWLVAVLVMASGALGMLTQPPRAVALDLRFNTTTTVTSSGSPTTYGESVTFSAKVVGCVTAIGETATFKDGSTTLGTGTFELSGIYYIATYSTSSLAASGSPHSITATYGGDFGCKPSTSTAISQTVNQAATTTSLTGAPSPSVFGESVTFTASVAAVAPGAGTPTGTVEFFDGATSLGTSALAAGVATLTTGALATTDHSLTAVYGGDTNFTTSTSTVFTQTVNQADTTTTLTGAPSPSVFGESVTLTATVAAVPPGAGTPTGAVEFYDGATDLGPGTLAGGVATLSVSSLEVASDSLTATYSGDTNFTTSTSTTFTQTVNQAATTTVLISAPNPSDFGQAVTFTASVTASAPGAGTPTGSVDFFDGATLLGTGTLDGSGNATLTTSTLALGGHSLTAVYGGDGNFTGSTSPVATQTVTQADTTTVLTSAPNPSVFGQSVTFTASVTASAPGAGTPTGTVDFFDGATHLGSGTLNGSGNATLTINTLALGSHSLTAVYAGDGNFTGSTSPVATQTVNQAPTYTNVMSSLNPSVLGQPVTFTASVLPVAATGTVQFEVDGVDLGTPVTLVGGVATSTSTQASTLSTGTHTITAVYSGGSNYLGSTGTLSQVVNAITISGGPSEPVFMGTATPVIISTPVPTATATATAVPPTATSTATVAAVAPAVATSTATPVPVPDLVIHNQRHTVNGGRTQPCDLKGNTNGKIERGCEVVSSVWLPGATVTYTLSYPDGTSQSFVDTADSRGHSLHPFAVKYLPPVGAKHGQPSTVANIEVTAKSADGTHTASAKLRFAVIR